MTAIAKELAKSQREISVSEFFEKNRHLLGYDNKIKALLMIVKEAMDNALDATEEAGILPDIHVKIEEVGKEKYKVMIRDNGPGIVKKQIPNIFGKLLYGSKFHNIRQSRGQQGLGISCGVLYSQLTTGEPVEIMSSIGDGKTHKYRLKINVKHNEPEILSSKVVDGKEWHGVQVTFKCEGLYREHKQSVLEYLKRTAISNPYASITFNSPNGTVEFKRGTDKMPVQPKAIKPHLRGVELGVLTRMLHATKARSISNFLVTDFSRVGKTTSDEICKKAEIDPRISPRRIEDADIVKLMEAIKETKLINPPTDCLSPLNTPLVEDGLKKELSPEWVSAISRPPTVYRGWPFAVEVGIGYGGSIVNSNVMRFANRVPLLYQQGDCAITKALNSIDWRRYGLQSRDLSEDPVVVFVHMLSVWVPFTSESKEAVASYPIILKETRLALQECARKLSLYLSGKRKAEKYAERLKTLERYMNETAIALSELTGKKSAEIKKKMAELIGK